MSKLLTALFVVAFSSLALAQEMSLHPAYQVAGAGGKGPANAVSFAYDPVRERILVADRGTNTIIVFSARGQFLFRIGETGGLSAPIGAAALPSGRVFILQEKNPVLKIYDEETPQLDSLNLAAVDSSAKLKITQILADGRGNLYLMDVGRGSILVLDKNLKKAGRFGFSGKGKLQQPVWLAVDPAGKMYVADLSDCPIRVFDPKGKFLACLERNRPAQGRFWRPAGICLDSKNRIWAIDAGAGSIRVFDASGNPLQTIDSTAGGTGRFSFPVQLAVDRYGQLYLLEEGKNVIEVFQIENY